MENNNNSAPPSAPVPATTTTDNGSVSQDSFLTEESSKDVPPATVNNGDENLSPISDSELDEDEGATNDTTDARPVSPVREDEAISQSNDGEKEQVGNDNEGTNASSPTAVDDDTNTGDVEMRDAESSVAAEETGEERKDADEENNNSGPAVQSSSGQSPEEQEEPMDVDETDKARRAATNETSQTHLDDDSVTNQSASDIGVTNTQDPHFHSMDDSVANDSIEQSNDQPENETDMFNETTEAPEQQDPPAEEVTQEEPPPPPTEEEDPDVNVQEIEIGTFKDVTVVTDEILNRTAFDKILEDTQKNISESIF